MMMSIREFSRRRYAASHAGADVSLSARQIDAASHACAHASREFAGYDARLVIIILLVDGDVDDWLISP